MFQFILILHSCYKLGVRLFSCKLYCLLIRCCLSIPIQQQQTILVLIASFHDNLGNQYQDVKAICPHTDL